MKKKLFSRSAIQLFAATSLAVKGEFPAVIISRQGAVSYTSADNAVKMEAIPGAVVKSSGTLNLEEEASVVVYCNGRIKLLADKGLHALPEVFKPGGLSTLNFDPGFGKYVRAAVEFVASKQMGDGWGTAVTEPKQGGDGWGNAVTDPKQGGDGWGTAVTPPKEGGDGWGTAVTPPKEGGDGWGNAVTPPKEGGDGWGKGAKIIPVLPFGSLQPGIALFSWSAPEDTRNFELDILDENDQVLHRATTPETSLSVDLGQLNLAPNQIYTWKVRIPGAGGLESGTLKFTLAAPEEQMAAAQKATRSSIYPSGDPALRGMMEAVALEQAEWYVAADQQYAALLREYPDNNMLRMMYAAFWMRYGLEQQAKAVLKG